MFCQQVYSSKYTRKIPLNRQEVSSQNLPSIQPIIAHTFDTQFKPTPPFTDISQLLPLNFAHFHNDTPQSMLITTSRNILLRKHAPFLMMRFQGNFTFDNYAHSRGRNFVFHKKFAFSHKRTHTQLYIYS